MGSGTLCKSLKVRLLSLLKRYADKWQGRYELPQRPRGWQYDFSAPDDPAVEILIPSSLTKPPNFVNHIYMELACATLSVRGFGKAFGIAWVTFCSMSLFLVFDEMVSDGFFPWKLIGVLILVLSAASWVVLYICRLDVEAPQEEPIRLNRARRKVYVYRFKYSALRPFSRSAWGLFPEVYDWDFIRAEYCTLYAPMGAGGFTQIVYLAAVDPGSSKVIDRFVFAHSQHEGKMYWAMARLYMQNGVTSVPRFDEPPSGWNNETDLDEITGHFAPKVKWPKVMDIESRTAP